MSFILKFLADGFWTVELWNKTQAGISRCLEALFKALMKNATTTKMDLEGNEIGADSAKAWCAIIFVECRGTYGCHVFDSETYGCNLIVVTSNARA